MEQDLQNKTPPDNMGRMNDPDGAAWIHGLCGDTMEIYLHVERGRIERALFHTDGCGSSIACGSAAAALAQGRSLGEALRISPADVLDMLGDSIGADVHCSILAVMTLQKALADYLIRYART